MKDGIAKVEKGRGVRGQERERERGNKSGERKVAMALKWPKQEYPSTVGTNLFSQKLSPHK